MDSLKPVVEPRLNFIECTSAGGKTHRMAYWNYSSEVVWADKTKPLIICAHGLTRNGRDFDVLASQLCERFRVIAVDFVGRGQSDRLHDPMHYAIPQYVQDAGVLLAQLMSQSAPHGVFWIGTSMGGIVGMLLAAMQPSPIRGLILNDIGPVISPIGIARISAYAGATPKLTSYAQAKAMVIANSAPFGEHTDEQWEYFVRHYVKQVGDEWILNHDPAIAIPFKAAGTQQPNLWSYFDAMTCPTHVLRGAQSDLLEHQTVIEMSQRGPKASFDEVENVGHAPTLMPPLQIQMIENALAKIMGLAYQPQMN
jgi:pimeloyl-ACP methyl ester carboxylesterase